LKKKTKHQKELTYTGMFVSSSIFGHVLAFINGKITFFGALEVNGNNGITVIKIDPTIKEMIGEIYFFLMDLLFLPMSVIHKGKNGIILSNQ
jgi:hypothetical protein